MPNRYNPVSSMNNITKNTSNTFSNNLMKEFFRYLNQLKSINDRQKKNLIIQYIHQLIENKHFKKNLKDEDGNSVLTVSCSYGLLDIVKLLLQKGADPNIQNNDGNTPLIEACYGNFPNIVELLLEKGADPNIQDNNGNPAYKIAFQKNHYNIFTILSNHSNIDFYGNNQVIDELLIKDIDKVSISDKVILNNLFIDIKENLNSLKNSVLKNSVSYIGTPLLKSIYTYELRIRNKLIKLEILDIIQFINSNYNRKKLEEKKKELYKLEYELESLYPSILVTDENTIRDRKKNLYDIKRLITQLTNKIEYEQRIRNKLIKLEILDIVKFINSSSNINELEEKKIELFLMGIELEFTYQERFVTDENAIRDKKNNLNNIERLILQLTNKIENIKNNKLNSTLVTLNNNYQPNQNNENINNSELNSTSIRLNSNYQTNQNNENNQVMY